ncbi:unnamed protein product [Rhodiola kirilowii]
MGALQVGVLIGKAGDTIRCLQINSGAKIHIARDAKADPRTATVELIGSLESIGKAKKLINDVISKANAGGAPSLVARGYLWNKLHGKFMENFRHQENEGLVTELFRKSRISITFSS